MSEVKLTVGIPTHNGSMYIKETINSILSQLDGIDQNQLEILISDNASTDNTEEIINEYMMQCLNIFSYYKNDVNVGYDRNVDLIFKRAKGKYVKLLGDDDTLIENSLNKILRIISTCPELAVILHSITFIDTNNNKKIETPKVISEDLFCIDGNIFFQKSKWGTAALSSLIIRKNDWNNSNLEKYVGTQWIHIAGIIEILKADRNLFSYIVAEEMSIVRVNNLRWESNFGNQLKVGMVHLDVLNGLLKNGYNKETFDIFLHDRYDHNLWDIIILKSVKFKDNLETAKCMVRFFYNRPFFWIFHLPILLIIPKRVCEIILISKDYFKGLVLGKFATT